MYQGSSSVTRFECPARKLPEIWCLFHSANMPHLQAAFTEFSGMKAANALPLTPRTQTFSSQVAAQKSTVNPSNASASRSTLLAELEDEASSESAYDSYENNSIIISNDRPTR